MPIAVDSTEQQPTISIANPNAITTNLSPDSLEYRSQNAAFGIGNAIGVDKGQIKDTIANGNEDALREFSAAKVNELKTQQLRDWIAIGSVSDETLKDIAKFQDPKSVFEEHYAKSYMDHLNWPSDPKKKANDNWAYTSQINLPEQWDWVKNAGSVGLAKDNYLIAKKQNDDANWVDTLSATAKDIFTAGLYGEVQMRQNTAGTSPLEFPGLGHQLQAQSDNLAQIKDFNEWRTEVDRVWELLPKAYRSAWADDMLHKSSADTWAADAQTALNALPIAKGITNLGRNVLTAEGRAAAFSTSGSARTKRVADSLNMQSHFQRIIDAVDSMTTPRPTNVAPEIAAPAMAGNIHESAVNKVAIDGINELKGTNNPIVEFINRLSALYDADGSLAASSPGNLGREAANRLRDMFDARKQDFIDTVFNNLLQRVDRTPTVELKEQLRNIQLNLAELYRGSDNQVLNVSRGIWLPGLNHRLFNVAVGTVDAGLFGSIEEARAVARRNGWAVKGDYVATPEERLKIQRKEAAIKGWRVQATMASTPEGAAKATALADKAQEELDKIPRHTTGITVEENRGGFIGPPTAQQAFIGPFNPNTIAGRLKEVDRREGWIKQQGNGYYILHTVYLPENARFVKDGLLTSDLGNLSVEEFRAKLAKGEVSTGIPNDWAGGWINAITNQIGMAAPSEVLSIAENLNRQIATHGPSVLLGLMKRGLQPVKKVYPKYTNDFNRLIRYTQSAFNPETKTPGIWFDTASDISAWYDRTIGRMPSEEEIQAYFAFKTVMLDDLNFRNLSVMTRKLALGAKQHAIRYENAYGEKTATPFFEGVRLDTLPQEGRALFVRSDGTKRYGRVRTVIGNTAGLENDIASGRAQIIHLMDPKSKPLSDVDPRGVDYVISYNTEEKPLGMQHVNRLGGGHQVPKWDFFAKQADVDVSEYQGKNGVETFRRYNGDKTLLSFKSNAEAQEAIQYLEPVRKLIARWMEANPNRDMRAIERWENEGGNTGPDYLGEAATLAQRTGIPFRKLLDIWTGPNAPFDVNEPIQVVRKGERIIGVDNQLKIRHPGIEDGTERNQSSLLAQSMVEFTQERDNEGLWTMRKTGTESNPYFAYEPAEMIDPITSLERGYKNIVESMYMYDMKMYSMNHWLEQATPWLKVRGELDNIRQNPLKHFYGPEYVDDIDPKIKMQLEGNRLAALDFIGLHSPYESAVKRLGQDTFDSLYGIGKFTLQSLNDLPSVKKFSQWMKNIAFYSTMVSFKSFFTQAASIANIYMIAGPENASKATAAMYHYGLWKRFSGDEGILNELDKRMAMFHEWEPGRFKEAVKMIEGSGFGYVGAEHAFRQGETSLGLQSADKINNFGLALKMTQKAGRAMLDVGGAPFDIGAYTTRASAFFTSYLEHVAKAPAGIIDRQLQASMLGRASLLDSNMSRAHNTWLQEHYLSIPAQFMSYDIRNTQMMWGKNLTREEKMRMFAWSTTLYGMKGGGALLFGLPLAQMTYNAATSAGYVPGDNWMADMVMQGFPSWYFAMLSGFGDPKKGTWVDFSRWGSRGIDAIEHFFDTDKTIAEQMTGVAGSFISNLAHNTWGIRQATWDAFKQDGYRLTSDDILQVANTLAAAGDIRQAYLAFQYGKWFTKNETYITDMSKVQTFLKLFTGLSPISGADVFLKQKYMESVEKDIRGLESHLSAEVTRAYREGSADPSAYHRHMKNAVTIQMAIPDAKRAEAEKSAMRNLEMSLRERLNEKLFIQLKNDFEMYKKVYQRGM